MKKAIIITPGTGSSIDRIGDMLFEYINNNRPRDWVAYKIHHQPYGDYEIADPDGYKARYPGMDILCERVEANPLTVFHSHIWYPLSLDENEEEWLERLRSFRTTARDYEITGSSPLAYTVHSLAAWEMEQSPYNKPSYIERLINCINGGRNRKKRIEIFKSAVPAKTQEKWLRVADKIVCVSRFTKQLVEELYPKYEDKCIVIPNGTDYFELNEERVREEMGAFIKEHGMKHNILYVGRVVRDMGVPELVKAFKKLSKRYENLRLVIVGDGNLLDDPEIREMKEKGSVLVLGHIDSREKIAALYRCSITVVKPSYHDTFNLVAAEALTQGILPVVSNVDGPKEYWVDTGVAVGIIPGEVDSIYRGIKWVIDNPHEAQRRARRGRELVKHRYTSQIMSESHIDLYEEMLKKLTLKARPVLYN